MDAAAALIRWTEVRRREFVIVHFVRSPKAKPASGAEDIRVQELIAELALRIVLLTQLYKLGDLLIARFQFRRRRGIQLSPVRPGVEWSQFFFDHGHQLPDRRPVLFPGKVNRYTGLFVTRTQP